MRCNLVTLIYKWWRSYEIKTEQHYVANRILMICIYITLTFSSLFKILTLLTKFKKWTTTGLPVDENSQQINKRKMSKL